MRFLCLAIVAVSAVAAVPGENLPRTHEWYPASSEDDCSALNVPTDGVHRSDPRDIACLEVSQSMFHKVCQVT